MGTKTIPTQDSVALVWGENLVNNLSGLSTTLELVGAEVGDLTGRYWSYRNAVREQEQRLSAAQSGTAAKNLAREAFIRSARNLVKRAKGSRNYTPAIGEQLGLVAPVATPPGQRLAVAAQRPVLICRSDIEGQVKLRFAKQGFTGVLISCRRGAETGFTLLSKQLASPLVDTRPNLNPGVPELRYYQAQFVEKDQPTGEFSDILVVTVTPRM